MHHFFASASREQTWRLSASAPVLTEERFDIGAAVQTSPEGALRIAATDDLERACRDHGLRDLGPELRAGTDFSSDLVKSSLERVASGAMPGWSVRFVARSRKVVREGAEHAAAESFIAIAGPHAAISVVSSSISLAEDCSLLQTIAAREQGTPCDYRTLPIVWRNGSGGVLFHEAAGHASEEGAPSLHWPGWLAVVDDPAAAGLERDDAGCLARSSDLLREPPAAMRRESFRDVPLARMTSVRVSGEAPFDLPRDRIEVLLLGGGRFDPLTDEVMVYVAAADLVRDGKRASVRPFVFRERRDALADRVAGMDGEPARYPGVICSREGQRVLVRTASPDLLTEAFSR